jgi:uncharacterized membrane protein YgcG
MKKLVLMIGLLAVGLSLRLTPVSANAYGDVINRMDVTMVVDENGKIDVDTKIWITFGQPAQGIYAYIPQSYDVTWTIDGENIDKYYYFPVRNIQVKDREFITETDDKDNVLVRIGTEGTFLSGQQIYEYSYTLQLRDLDLGGLQAFYMDVIGEGWDFPMEQVNVKVTLPNGWPFEPDITTGSYGSNTPITTYTIAGNTLTMTHTNLGEYEAITIYAPVSETGDYFTFIPPTDYSGIALGVLAAFSVGLYLAYLKFGKDDKPVITVEFNPIPGLSSSMAGYIYDGTVETRDVVSLIIEWANKGYLTISEDPSNTKNFTLTKIKDMAESEIRAEKTLFADLFRGRDSVTNKDLERSFYQSIANAKMDIARYFNGNPQREIFSKKATVLKVLFGIVTMIPAGLVLASAVYVGTYREDLALMAGIFSAIFGTILVIGWSSVVKRWPSLTETGRAGAVLGTGAISIMYALIYALIMILNYASMSGWSLIVLGITFALTVFNIALVSVMDKRTELGVSYLGKILGLKNFIETAEKDRLEALVHDDPQYFYKLLPYAYVLNVTDVWSKKFESIAMENPSWYVGPSRMNTFLWMNHFNRAMNTFSSSMTSVPQSRGRAGGGFGGGGGFSGGGFGGGGGGRW